MRTLYDSGPMSQFESGAAIFDPFLTELLVEWFSAPGYTVLDPFAGGCVRGIVASRCGRKYVGVDLSEAQVAANREIAKQMLKAGTLKKELAPEWRLGDSADIEELAVDVDAELILTSPPYYNEEVYSDDPRDLSTMTETAFLSAYQGVIAGSVARLKQNRFAAIVVGDIRESDGTLRNLSSETVRVFEKAGCTLYNKAVYQRPRGGLERGFLGESVLKTMGRLEGWSLKTPLVQSHEDVLIFAKGEWREAAKACGLLGSHKNPPGRDL